MVGMDGGVPYVEYNSEWNIWGKLCRLIGLKRVTIVYGLFAAMRDMEWIYGGLLREGGECTGPRTRGNMDPVECGEPSGLACECARKGWLSAYVG